MAGVRAPCRQPNANRTKISKNTTKRGERENTTQNLENYNPNAATIAFADADVYISWCAVVQSTNNQKS